MLSVYYKVVILLFLLPDVIDPALCGGIVGIRLEVGVFAFFDVMDLYK
jgi:hypothetical protein